MRLIVNYIKRLKSLTGSVSRLITSVPELNFCSVCGSDFSLNVSSCVAIVVHRKFLVFFFTGQTELGNFLFNLSWRYSIHGVMEFIFKSWISL